MGQYSTCFVAMVGCKRDKLTGLFSWLCYTSGVILGVSMLTFLLFSIAPGNPALVILAEKGEGLSHSQLAEYSKRLGIGKPLVKRYFLWLERACIGDFGRSWQTGEDVSTIIKEKALSTAELAFASFLWIVVFSVTFGILGSLTQSKILDALMINFSVLMQSFPSFWLGYILVAFFSVKLGWLPSLGKGGIKHILMPSFTLALSVAVVQGRMLRACLLKEMSKEYVLFARSKGFTDLYILFKHVLKNACSPLIAFWSLTLGRFLTGAVIVENVFSWPGIGQMLVQALLSRDMPLVQGTVLFIGVVYTVINKAGFLWQRWLEPRHCMLGE